MVTRMKPALLAAVVLLVFPGAAGGELKPIDLSPGGASASSPRLASDGVGNVVAVWREVNGDQSSIRAAFRQKGEAWGEVRQISVPASSTESPEVAMDRLGNAVAVWHRSTGRDSVVQAAVRPAGGTWSAPQDLSAAGDVAFNADVALEAGRTTAVWTVVRERRSIVESSSRTIAGSWEPAETVSAPDENAYAPVIAMDGRGGAVASWQWSDGGFLVVQAASRTSAGGWSAPEALSGPGRHATRPVIAMDANGNVLVGWVRYNGSWFAAQVARRNAGEAWAAAQNLSERGGNAGGLDLAMNRRGDAVVTWVQSHLTYIGSLWSSFRPAGAERWSRSPLTQAWRGLQARTALDEAGNATAVWAGSATISASFKPVGQPWQQNYLLSSYEHATAHPAVTTQAPREATAVWIRAETADDRIQGVFYDVDTAKDEEDEEEEEEEGDDEEDEEEDEEEEEEDDEESIEEGKTFRGTPKTDTLVGTPGNDVFFGYGGNDTIDGRGGRDVIYGGLGNDRIAGGRGADKLFGGLGSDRIIGGRGRDVLSGGPGSDVVDGGSGSDYLYGSRGHDVIDGRGGRDLVYGGLGDDRIQGGTGVDELFGGAGADRIAGGRASDVLMGGYGRDILSGNSGNDTLRALDRGTDAVFGGGGLDRYSLDRWLDRARSIESRL
jgi:hypothetical protein